MYKSIIGSRTRCIWRNRYKYEGLYSCQVGEIHNGTYVKFVNLLLWNDINLYYFPLKVLLPIYIYIYVCVCVRILLWDIYITYTKFGMGFRVVSLLRGLEIPGPDPKLFTDFECMCLTQLKRDDNILCPSTPWRRVGGAEL
jgi:hypothetical protein